MTKIDMIALQPSRKMSHASDVFVFDADAAPAEGSVVDECCLNQTNERSSSLRSRSDVHTSLINGSSYLESE